VTLLNEMKHKFPKNLTNNDVFFVCIGTDRSTGDSLGPFVGTFLKERGYKNVVGTIDDPVHAMNLKMVSSLLPKDKVIIAIDACLSCTTNIGQIQFGKGGLKPGAALNKNLPEVGDYYIKGVVNMSGFMEYEVIRCTRLSLVIKMAKDITNAICKKFPLDNDKNKRNVIKRTHKKRNNKNKLSNYLC